MSVDLNKNNLLWQVHFLLVDDRSGTEYVQFCVIVTGGSDSAVAPFVANLTPGGVAERYSLQYTATYVTMPYLPERHELTILGIVHTIGVL